MKRNQIIDNLIKEGFTEKTLVKFNDKQLVDLHERIVGEQVKKGGVIMPKSTPAPEIKKVTDQGINVELREKKPSAGLSKEKKSEIVKKAKKGKDIGKKGKGFEKIEKKAKESGAKDPKAVAAAAMWKNIKREGKNSDVKKWVKTLAESNFHEFTSKKEIMNLIQEKMEQHEVGPNVKKGHNNMPEFMTYDAISKSEVKESGTTTKPKTKPKTAPTKTPKPSTPYRPGPGKNPKPKALKEDKK